MRREALTEAQRRLAGAANPEDRFLRGELLRQLGRFDEAAAVFSGLSKEPRFAEDEPAVRLRFERQRVRARDAAPSGAPRHLTCPNDGTRFAGYTGPSGLGAHLDQRPLAFPHPVSACPTCNLAHVTGRLTEKQLERIRPLLQSEGYREAARDRPAFLAPAVLEALGESDLAIGFAWVQASWLVEDDPALLRTALEEASRRLSGAKDGFWGVMFLEVLRRAGRFEEAAAQVDSLDASVAPAVVDLERKLIRAHDTAPHLTPPR